MVAPALAGAILYNGIRKFGPTIIRGAQKLGNVMNLFGKKSNSAEQSYMYSRRLQTHQYELDRLARQHSFADTRKSLEEADYNPLLAVGEQANGGSYGASMSVTDPETENLQNRLGKIQAMVNIAAQSSQSKLNSSQAALNQEQSKATVQDVINKSRTTSAQVGLINSQKARQDLENNVYLQTGLSSARAQIENLKADTSSKYEQQRLYRVEQGLRNAEIGQVAATIKGINANTEQTNANTSAINANTRWVRNHPKQASFTQGLGSYTGAIGNIFGGSASYSASPTIIKGGSRGKN